MTKIGHIFIIYYLFKNIFCLSKDPAISFERITEFRQQHRKTLDGRLCAAAFLHDDHTYTDCTIVTSPDGTSGREWCYVDVQLLGKGSRDWDFCANTINYNKLRLHAKKLFEEKSLDADRLKDRLQMLNSKIHSMLNKYDSVCGTKHELISNRIDKINEWLNKSSNFMKKIEYNLIKLESKKKMIKNIQIEIENENSNIKNAEENCSELPGYENEPYSDGINAFYYNNILFEGIPTEIKKVKEINFHLNNRGPIENISPYKYSIRYKGFLMAPHNGSYTFIIHTDCFVRLLINKKVVIIHGFKEVDNEQEIYINVNNKTTIPKLNLVKNTTSNLNTLINTNEYDTIKQIIYPIIYDENKDEIKKYSNPIELVGGEKHEIIVEISYSGHLKYNKTETSFFKLLWKSSRIDEQIIQSGYFFSKNIIPPTRFSLIDANLFEIGLLDKNETIYKKKYTQSIVSNKQKGEGVEVGVEVGVGVEVEVEEKQEDEENISNWVIESVPTKYINLHTLKTYKNPNFTTFRLSINTGSILYIAFPYEDNLPISPVKESAWKAYDTSDIIEVKNKITNEKKKFKIKYISLKNKTILTFKLMKSIPFFFFLQKRKILPTICNGEEEILTSPKNRAYKSCIESSALSKEFNCLSGLNGSYKDTKYNVWRSYNGSIGEYIKVFFNTSVQINKFRFKPRDDILTWPSEIELHFDDTNITIPILHTSNKDYNTVKLEHPIITTSVKIEIKDMFRNNYETGGSFELIGNICNINTTTFTSNNISDNINKNKMNNSNDYYIYNQTIFEVTKCHDTLLNIPDVMPLLNGDKFLVTCDSKCLDEKSSMDEHVYGTDIYSVDSAICRAALHAGVINNKNKHIQSYTQNNQFIVLVSNTYNKDYIGTLQNNILSSNKNKNPNIFSFTMLPVINYKNYDFFGTASSYNTYIPQSFSIVFKNNENLSNNPNKFLIDSGDIFTNYGYYSYGWYKKILFSAESDTYLSSKSGLLYNSTTYPFNSNNNNFFNNLINSVYYSGINFPPASASEHCITKIDCIANYWKFEMQENGLYIIHVLVGNLQNSQNQTAFLEINGIPIIKNVNLKKGEHYTAVKYIEVTNKSLIFTSTCLEGDASDDDFKGCSNARTTIMAVQIIKVT
ncbi:LCCL domain-containing protein [Hepatocystis sp. ex Piliocolobus tephrosceles]|nr:LCCL domain-containing protein [Hepatocystis sp. ex Piliocolobus tephrosceles]